MATYTGCLIKIDGEVVPKIINYNVQYNKLWGEDSGRNLAGEMMATLTGIFPKITLNIGTVNEDEMAWFLAKANKMCIRDSNLFHYTSINGDSGMNEDEFDGLDKMVTGTKTEYIQEIDLSTSAAMDENYNKFLDEVGSFVSKMKGKPTMFLMNSVMKTKFKSIARRAGYYSRTEDAFGRSIDNWDGIPFVDLEEYFDGENTLPCVPIKEDGTTSIYAVQIAKDGFHGVSPTGDNIIATSLPDLKAPGAIKKGDVEMVAAVVLKNTLKAGVFRGIKVTPASAQPSHLSLDEEVASPYAQMKVEDLKALLDEYEIKYTSTMKKGDLVALLDQYVIEHEGE